MTELGYFFLVLLLGIISLLILLRPKFAIFLLFAYLYFFDWLFQNYLGLNLPLFWIPDFLLIILLIRALINVKDRGERSIKKTPIDIYFLFLIIIILVSALVNGGNFYGILLGVRRAVKSFAFFYILLYLDFDEPFLRKVIKSFVFIGFIQIPFALSEFFGESFFFNLWADPSLRAIRGLVGVDANTGTFGGSASALVSLYVIGIIFLVFGLALYQKKRISLFTVSSIIFLSLIFPLAVSGGAIWILLMTMLLMILFSSGISVRKRIGFALVSVVVSLLVIQLLPIFVTMKYGESVLPNYFNFQAIFKSQSTLPIGPDAAQSQGRLAMFVYTVNRLARLSPITLLFGFGPGNLLPSQGFNLVGNQFEPYLPNIGNTYITSIVGELGIVCLALLGIIFARLVVMNLMFYKTNKDGFWKAVSFANLALTFVFILGSAYTTTWNSDVLAFPFWFMTSSLLSLYKKDKNSTIK